ncbi:MAG: hypothetical protein PHH21_01595 [Candidatus Pacebacteria bacterium]|nr:hypothetical protein [Candidatus Paceibacterota bacterium]
MTTTELIQMIENKELADFLFPFRALFIFMTLLLLFALIWYFFNQKVIWNDVKRRIKDFLSFQRFTPPRSFSTRCKEINNMLDKGDHRRAILRMEELFYELLKRFNYSGKTLRQMADDPSVPDGENLKRLAEVAEAVKKDRQYSVNIEEMDKMFESFEETLKKFGVITDEVED